MILKKVVQIKFLSILFFSNVSYSLEGKDFLSYYNDSESYIIENKKSFDFNSIKRLPSYILEYKNIKRYPTEEELNYIGRKYQIPDGILYAMLWKESQYSCHSKSSKGAYGCFQFKRETAIKMNIIGKKYDYRNNPWISADAAARYLVWNFNYLELKNYNDLNNWEYVLAAYNAGPNKVKQKNILKIPLYTETQYYIEDIIGYAKGDKYIVKNGDLMHEIAEISFLDVETLSVINGNLSNKKLKIGSFLNIKKPKEISKYMIKNGDSLLKVASLNNTTIQHLGKFNNISSLKNIKEGEILYIPIY